MQNSFLRACSTPQQGEPRFPRTSSGGSVWHRWGGRDSPYRRSLPVRSPSGTREMSMCYVSQEASLMG